MATEREIKLDLDERHARRIAELLGPALRVVKQRNHYLDTRGGALGKLGFGLRLRSERPGTLTLTLKGPATLQAAVTERREDEATITPPEADRILGGQATLASLNLAAPPELLAACGAQPLICWGTLDNERRVFRLRGEDFGLTPGAGFVVELDRTAYPDGIEEHELEAELHDPQAPSPEPALRALLARAGAPWRLQPEGKLARLRARTRK